MAVKIRMTRMGRRNRPFYRIGAYDSRSPRNGKCIENLGWYDPLGKTPETQLRVDLKRVEYWLSVGAQPTPKTLPLLKKAGVIFPKKANKKKKEKKKEEKKSK